MRKSFIRMAVAIIVVLMSVSCQPESPVSRQPEYERPLKFTLDKSETVTWWNQDKVNTVISCHVGDSVTVYLPTIYTGTYIYKIEYKWTSSSEALGALTFVQKDDPCSMSVLPPKWTFKAPNTPGEYEVYFRAKYYYSAKSEDGTIIGSYPVNSYEEKSSVYGRLIVKE